jgi:hypothetical protein
MNARAKPPQAPASSEQVMDFLRWLYRRRLETKQHLPRLDDKALIDAMPSEFRNNLQGIGRRLMMDLVRGGPVARGMPKPRGGKAKAITQPKRAARAPTRRRRKKSIRK